VAPYLLDGKDVFVGAESLVERGLAEGAAGSVSGLAAAFPEGVEPERRGMLERYPFQAALKSVIAFRGVPVREDVRAPLRSLTAAERAELRAWLESS
jgi:dihydrodipicolinate synthase/N-acetylneuraminate lyase